MQELIKNFGINGYLLVAQIINFLIILYILKRFAYKPITQILENRRKMIEGSKKNAEAAEKALQKAIVQEKELLKKAQTEAQKILTDAQSQAADIIMNANTSGQKQVEKLLHDARDQIGKDRAKSEKELALYVAELAVTMVKKSLSSLVEEKDQESLLRRVQKEFSKKKP